MKKLRRRARELVETVQRHPLGRRAIRPLLRRVGAGRSPVRVDPVPELEPLPSARYAFLIGAVPRRFGGRTASILTKARLLKELGGVDSMIVTLHYQATRADIRADLRRRGLLVEGVEVVNLYEHLRGAEPEPAEPVRHPVDEPGMEKVRDADEGLYRYLQNGVHRLSKRFDASGRLVHREWFDENQVLTQRDEFGVDGRLRRTSHLDQEDRSRRQVYFRADGSPYLEKALRLAGSTGTAEVQQVRLLDEQGQPSAVLADDTALAHHFLDQLFGSDHVFLTIESRRNDRETLGYRRPNVKRLALVHNLHLSPPGNLPARIRSTYRPLFRHRKELGAVVFLTNTQRADAEARFGQQPNFWVIPHPTPTFPQVPFEQRDPHLVVMLARLHPQKQLTHAIRAFALVVKAVPAARLEIYGEGPERAMLQRLIDQLGVGGSVTLPGYTRDAAAVYERAALSLLTSRNEGYPLTLLETLAHGCPVVSYDVKYGPSEIVADGVNGYLVGSGDVRRLAKRVIEVLSESSLRRRLSEQAGATSPELSEHTFVARWSRLFRDLDARGWD